MNEIAYKRLTALASAPEAQEKAIEYITDNLRQFLKERDKAEDVHCQLDVEIFLNHFVPRFAIQRRYVGTEPLSPMTGRYNEILKELLPSRGVEVREIPRLEEMSAPISASAVRAALAEGNRELLQHLLPATTLSYMEERGLWK